LKMNTILFRTYNNFQPNAMQEAKIGHANVEQNWRSAIKE